MNQQKEIEVIVIPPKRSYRDTVITVKPSENWNEYYRQYYHLYIKTGKRGNKKKVNEEV